MTSYMYIAPGLGHITLEDRIFMSNKRCFIVIIIIIIIIIINFIFFIIYLFIYFIF